jgi:hypothetical protein
MVFSVQYMLRSYKRVVLMERSEKRRHSLLEWHIEIQSTVNLLEKEGIVGEFEENFQERVRESKEKRNWKPLPEDW